MSILANTRPASFRGVPFRMRSSNATEGINRANFLYIGTDRRTSKALSEYPIDFNLECFTHGLTGQQYEERRNALRTALKDPTPGVLVHPFLGPITVVAGKYSFTENYQESGVCKFTIPFSKAEESGFNPVKVSVSPSRIKALGLVANRALQAASAASYVNTTVLNKDSSKSLFQKVKDGLNKFFGPLADTIQKASDYTGKALAISEQASFYANNPLVGFAALADGVLGIDGLTTDVYSKFRAVQNMFDYGDDGTEFSVATTSPSPILPTPLTFENAERKNNANIFKTFMQGAAGIEAYSQAGNNTYDTAEDIDQARQILNTQFEKMVSAMTAEPAAPFYPTPDYTAALDALNDVADATNQYLDQQLTKAPRLEKFRANGLPVEVIAYTIYGDSTRFDEIYNINGLRDVMAVSGEIEVLSK